VYRIEGDGLWNGDISALLKGHNVQYWKGWSVEW